VIATSIFTAGTNCFTFLSRTHTILKRMSGVDFRSHSRRAVWGLIGRHGDLRAFSGPGTYTTEESAITGCCEFGRRIIDGRVRECSVDDLSGG
jgi:hypothetical protein